MVRACSTPWSQTIHSSYPATPTFRPKTYLKSTKESIPLKIPFTFYGRFAPNAHLLHFFSLLVLPFESEQTSGNISLYAIRIYIYIFFGARVNFQSEDAEFDKEGGAGGVSVFLSWSIGLIKWIWALWREIGWKRLTWLASDVGCFHVKLPDYIVFEREHGTGVGVDFKLMGRRMNDFFCVCCWQ